MSEMEERIERLERLTVMNDSDNSGILRAVTSLLVSHRAMIEANLKRIEALETYVVDSSRSRAL